MANEGKLVIYNGMGKEETVQDLTTEQNKILQMLEHGLIIKSLNKKIMLNQVIKNF